LNVLREFSLPEVIAANEENHAGAFGSLYADWVEALSHVGEDAVWGLTRIPSPMINNATRVRFQDEKADDAIDSIIKVAHSRKVPMRWWLGPGTQPSDIGERSGLGILTRRARRNAQRITNVQFSRRMCILSYEVPATRKNDGHPHCQAC